MHAVRAISVLYGSRSGLTSVGSQRIDPPASPTEPLGRFGTQLSVGDLDGDGVTDLVATAEYLQEADGKVVVLYGDLQGLNRGPDEPTVLQGDGVDIAPGWWVTGIATGDFNGDGRDELAVGQLSSEQGQVFVLNRGGSTFSRTAVLEMRMPSVPRTQQISSDFGAQMAVGDANGDGRDELAIGATKPFCDAECDEGLQPPNSSGDGAVAVFRGSSTGLSGRGTQLWTQDSPGVVGTSTRDGFGASLAFGRLDGDATDDLLVGVPYADINSHKGAGSVTVLLGSRTGLTTNGAGGSRFSQDTRGIAGTAERGDWFDKTVSIVQLSRTGPGAAVIGVPLEDLGSTVNPGQIHQLAPGGSGPKTTGTRTINADRAGVQGVAKRFDHFGDSLS